MSWRDGKDPLEMNMRIVAIPALVGLVVLTPGCLIDSDTKTVRTGDYVSPEVFGKVVPGTRSEDVVEMLGPPTTTKTTDDGREVWTWVYREEVTTRGSVFLLLSNKTESVHRKEVSVELRDGVVTRTW